MERVWSTALATRAGTRVELAGWLHRYEEYHAALSARGLSEEPFRGYLDAFRHGMPPHGGCALGLERWVARLVDAPNVRETTLFPRDVNRLTP
jgi:nondiscriminating aspartyl-tRNA synthetase